MLLCKAVIIVRCLPAGFRPAPAVHCGDPGAIARPLPERYPEAPAPCRWGSFALVGGRLERPDLQAVYGVPHIHGQVDSLEGLGVVEVVDRDGCGGRAAGYQAFTQVAKTPTKRLPGVILGKV